MASLVTIHNYQAAAGLCNKGPIEGWMEPQYGHLYCVLRGVVRSRPEVGTKPVQRSNAI